MTATVTPMRRATTLRTRIALYAACATVLFVLERALPNPVPWLRLGLANAVTLVVLLEHGMAPAAAVVGVRLVLGGFFAASLFGPQFVLAASGATASWLVMSIAARARLWSPLGLSLLGASAHALAQLAAASWVFGGGLGLWTLLPLFLTLAIVTGTVTGFAADLLLRRLDVASARRGG
jgi:heptaprenyl diphosphate synthase